MKFFVDSADLDAISELADIGLVDGVTTNPSIIAKSGRDFKEVIKEICSLTDGHVSAEVVATQAEQMIEEGRHLRKICLLYTSPSPRDGLLSRMPSSA